MKFDEKLQKLRKASGLSQEALADKLNISRQAVSKWESGVSYPETDKLIQMSKIFNCSLDELVNDTETDKSIYTNKQKKKNMYLDSLMEFITKSVNMFSNMKFSNIVKALIELFIVGVILLIISLILYSLGDALISELFWSFNFDNDIVFSVIRFISSILEFVWLLIIVAVALIIFIQVYKIRYLDYYDKLVYEFEQKEELKKEENEEIEKEEVKEEKKKNKKEKLEEKKRDRIIIRDPEHRPFAFLGAVSNVIIKIVKFFACIFSVPFVCSLVFFVISFVICVYLISINKLFIGAVIALIGVIVFNILVIEMLYKFITSIVMNKKRILIEGLLCIIVSSIGVGLFFVNLKDIEFLEHSDESFERISEVVEYDSTKNTVEILNHPYSVVLVVDNNIKKDLKLSFNYNKDIHSYEIRNENNKIILDFDPKVDSIKEAINLTLNDLKNNKIRLYDVYDYPFVEVRGSEEDIKSLVLYLRDQEGVIYTDSDLDGVYHAY